MVFSCAEAIMPTPLERAKYYRKLAAECVRLADGATADSFHALYRKLAGQYLNLVDAELTLEEEGRSRRRLAKR
jgi:hypothetical protein